jgi:hypothetical protein
MLKDNHTPNQTPGFLLLQIKLIGVTYHKGLHK